MKITTETDPVLGADFAERVLARADVVIARQRLVRRVAGGGAALAFVSVAVVSWLMMSGMVQSPAPRSGSQTLASLDATTNTQADESDALSDLFPDAGSVARFATEYSDATDGPDTALLPDEDPTS
jgi:hypothetical protein